MKVDNDDKKNVQPMISETCSEEESVSPCTEDNLDEFGTQVHVERQTTVEKLETHIAALEQSLQVVTTTQDLLVRTRDNISPLTSGQVLGKQLTRQIERRVVLESLRQSPSVIVQNPSASTPNISGLAEPSPQSFFGSVDNLSNPFSSPDPTLVTPQYPAFPIYQDTAPPPPRIPVVTTPCSIGQENLPPPPQSEAMAPLDITVQTPERIRELIEELLKKSSKVKAYLDLFDPTKHSPEVLRRNEDKWMSKLEDAYLEFMEFFFTLQVPDGHPQETELQGIADGMKEKMNDFTMAFNMKVMSLGVASEQISVNSNSTVNNSSSLAAHKRNQARVNAEVDLEKVRSDAKDLSEEVRRVKDWTKASNKDVEEAMHERKDWKKRFRSIQENLWNAKKVIHGNNLDTSELQLQEAAVTTLEAELEMAVNDIELEDNNRGLYSVSKSKTANVKYPTFSGNKDEDYLRFEKEVREAFVSNRVKTADQAKTLRDDCLKGEAKSYIPKDLEDIEGAFKILKTDAGYGDSSRMMTFKKDKLLNMGKYPKPGSLSPSHLKQQIDWLMQLDLLLGEISDLAELSMDMYTEFYNPSVWKLIKSNFPHDMAIEMGGFTGTVEEKMKALLKYVRTHRTKVNELKKDTPASGSTDKSQKVNHGAVGKSSHPQRNEQCRICKHLEQSGDTEDIYEDHVGKSCFGCPRFAKMTLIERFNIVYKTRICLFCLDANYVHKSKFDRHQNCPSLSPNYQNKCSECRYHYLVCQKHKSSNQDKLDKSKDFWSKRGKEFVANVSYFPLHTRTAPAPQPSPTIPSVPQPTSAASASGGAAAVPQPGVSAAVNFSEGIVEATKKLKQLAKGAKVIEVPDGEPLFLFSTVVGKTRPLNCFYDRGCSHVVWKTGVPQVELEAVKTKEGPLKMHTAGDNTVTVGDEWACLVNMMDGSKQVMVGVDCNKITSTFPMIKTGAAMKEILKKCPQKIRNTIFKLKVPDIVGGDPDILLGIHYEACHPEVLHTLDSGLFVAKLKLASSSGYTACIGGPHRSFAFLADHVGDAVRLMSCFTQGLKDYHLLGAPKLPAPMMTVEDIEFAFSMNKAEVTEIIGTEIEEDVEADGVSVLLGPDGTTAAKEDCFGFTWQCNTCGDDVAENLGEIVAEIADKVGKEKMERILAAAKEVEPDERLLDLKTLLKVQEEGISLEYRCPRCRNCSDCRNASETEKVSVREEIEDQAIRDSVKIDFANKKITARLPLRGDEDQFLSDNRNIALKTLKSQCIKVKDDEETKTTIVKAFKKLEDNKHAVRFDDLTDEQKQKIEAKKTQLYLPWRVVFKPSSVSTGCRPVFDGSSKTPVLPDGRGGHCLNNLAMKGRVNTLDLLNMLLRFEMGPVALAGDLKQFYCSIALDEDQFNLQRVLYCEDMDINSPVIEMVIVSLIFGVRSVSALSERAILDLAAHVTEDNPRLAEFLEQSRFVDDLADSDLAMKYIDKLKKDADELFDSVSLKCKGWTVSGDSPHPDCSHDGVSLDVGGMTWNSQLDTMMVKIPPLHFGRKSRGRLVIGTETFEGSFADLDAFVPQFLTRRQIVSKFASLYDPYGKLVPVSAAMKVHLRMAVLETEDWDNHVSKELRAVWVQNFWRMYKLRGLQYNRARVPVDAANTDLHLVCAVDAANDLKICGVWGRFLRTNGKYSKQLIVGRSLLGKEGNSIAKEELEALTIGSNLLWIVRRSLAGWTTDYCLLSDSVITLCWTTTDKKRLSLFHRNRANQIRMNTSLDKMFHVRSEYNCSDCATRPDKIQETSVGPASVWESGLDWMEDSLESAVQAGILTPALDLRMVDTEENEYDKGLVLERTPEILVRGHAVTEERVDKMRQRAEFSNYLLMPTKYNMRKVVRITALVFKFIRKLKFKRLERVEKHFRMFSSTLATPGPFPIDSTEKVSAETTDKPSPENNEVPDVDICWGAEKSGAPDNNTSPVPRFDDEDIARALMYWYRKATLEVEQFVKADTIKKLAVKKNGILYCRSRILDGQRFLEAGDLRVESLGKDVGLSLMVPLVDRFSPIAYSIAAFIHNEVGKHAGWETCLRLSIEYAHILQGGSLFRQLSDECSKCKKYRQKFLEVVMGPVSEHQLTISPPFHTAFCDLDGPYHVFVPGHERETRNKKVMSCAVYVMTFVCPMSKLCNLQVIETKSAEGVLEGLMRLTCEVGCPAYLVLDQETSFLKMVRDAEISLQDISYRAYKEMGIQFEVAPVSGHNHIGLVERRIQAVQGALEKLDLKKTRLHATGLQTFCKIAENSINNTPLGYSYGRDDNNTPILKIITPNLLKIGRLHSRAMTGPMKYPNGPSDFLKKVSDTYEAWYKIWNENYLPKLIPQPKWFKESPELKPNDVVFFDKNFDNELSSDWTVGTVESVTRSKDGVVRRVDIKYQNSTENLGHYRYTDRSVRSIVRLFSLEDAYWVEDMAEVERLIRGIEEKNNSNSGAAAQFMQQSQDDGCEECCCVAHCGHIHDNNPRYSNNKIKAMINDVGVSGVNIFPDAEREDDFDQQLVSNLMLPFHRQDEVYKLMTSLETKFDLEEE